MEFDDVIASYLSHGFRLEMIFPADSPRVAQLSRGEERITIESDEILSSDGGWHVGRAGMEYRDLIPDRLGGRVIASHIRIPTGGPIPDYVHYHAVDFQVICCLSGTARLVYEDQGDPFTFVAGDCVLQPPGIRHRVLECSDGFEVFEVGSPAEHPTFAEHSFDLPTDVFAPDRLFGSQKFVHHRAAEAAVIKRSSISIRETGIRKASAGAGDVYVVSSSIGGVFKPDALGETLRVCFVASGTICASGTTIGAGEAFVGDDGTIEIGKNSEIIMVEVSCRSAIVQVTGDT